MISPNTPTNAGTSNPRTRRRAHGIKSPLTFQEIICQLGEFWKDHGCLLMQPVDKEVGAGTFSLSI